MKHPEEICAEIAAAMTTDAFTFYYGSPPDQNFEVDEFTFPAILLDKPIVANVFNSKAGTRELKITMNLFFAYLSEMDHTEAFKFNNIKKRAWTAAREFVLRIRKTDLIKREVDEKLSDVDHVFDIELSGCLLELTVTIVDVDSICLT
jgi:hypothetical protein